MKKKSTVRGGSAALGVTDRIPSGSSIEDPCQQILIFHGLQISVAEAMRCQGTRFPVSGFVLAAIYSYRTSSTVHLLTVLHALYPGPLKLHPVDIGPLVSEELGLHIE